jgi:flagellar protein FlaH
MGSKMIKILEVAKVRGAELNTGNIISFDVEPNWGIRVIPYSKARA